MHNILYSAHNGYLNEICCVENCDSAQLTLLIDYKPLNNLIHSLFDQRDLLICVYAEAQSIIRRRELQDKQVKNKKVPCKSQGSILFKSTSLMTSMSNF